MAASSIMPVGCSKAEMGRENWTSWTVCSLEQLNNRTVTTDCQSSGAGMILQNCQNWEEGTRLHITMSPRHLWASVLGWGSSLCLEAGISDVKSCEPSSLNAPLTVRFMPWPLSRYLGFKVLTAHTCPTSQPKEQSHNLRKSLECAYNSGPCIHSFHLCLLMGWEGKA